LDVGCRNRKTPNSIGIDLEAHSQADIVADAEHLPFKDASFQSAVLSHIIEHVNALTVLRETRRVLVLSGGIYVETPNPYRLPVLVRFIVKGTYAVSRDHIQIFGVTELTQLLTATGFSITRVEYKGGPGSLFSKLVFRFLPHLKASISIHARQSAFR
jgi:ubiquinone/menaquinone biosynthesis C-methylase UbiE